MTASPASQVKDSSWAEHVSSPLLPLDHLDRGWKADMIESNIEDGGNPGSDLGMERAKLRTISCSTEER